MTTEVVNFLNALKGRGEISITVQGRRTGRQITLPVWFIQEGHTIYLLPVKGSRTQWFRNLVANPTIALRSGQQRVTSKARPIQDLHQTQEIAEKFRARYRADQVARYYSVFDAYVEVPLERSEK